MRRLARTAGVGAWEQLSPHSLRHSAITFALDAGASLRDVQDYAGHKDPRTTRQNTAAAVSTATPPTPSLLTWRDSIAGPAHPATTGPGLAEDPVPLFLGPLSAQQCGSSHAE